MAQRTVRVRVEEVDGFIEKEKAAGAISCVRGNVSGGMVEVTCTYRDDL